MFISYPSWWFACATLLKGEELFIDGNLIGHSVLGLGKCHHRGQHFSQSHLESIKISISSIELEVDRIKVLFRTTVSSSLPLAAILPQVFRVYPEGL